MTNAQTKHTYSKIVSKLRKALKSEGFTDIKFSYGYFYFSCFATRNGKVLYSFISDSRNMDLKTIYMRTATDYKDFTGGQNHRASLNIEDMALTAVMLTSDIKKNI